MNGPANLRAPRWLPANIRRRRRNVELIVRQIIHGLQPAERAQVIQLVMRAGQLQLLESPRWIAPQDGRAQLEFDLPLHGVSLLVLAW